MRDILFDCEVIVSFWLSCLSTETVNLQNRSYSLIWLMLSYMTAEVSVLLIPAVPVCQSSIESPQCSFFPYCYAMYYSLASFLSGIRQRIELQTTILQLAHPSFWQQINKRSTRGQLYKSWVAFPLMTNYQNVFYSLAHNTYLTDGEVRATKRDITCRFLIGWFLSFVVVSCFLLIFLPPPHIYYI